ncbi:MULTISPECIES: hypothetical protein [Arthrospira]|jgi:hypothetical protein|uniref:Uncharacterized protein n=1 Tax=Limnospira platensis NIES-46 TaxID=1236695 RepID=A0A5M3T1B2_LIMPL|nr:MULTISPECIES: hypothetical protein [Arthrospira]AMW28228.1 hypothetical protein AP285_09805 [Arthrospira platensis YZ]KDR56850.1 hypothetical protein APPUASWS_014560 [Arthrospira platensis str. Paraca]MBD2670819.1 hypothetical protein [Arthrospira platensis FACHB-439]MBD2711555.1 hypothetical protein [Arthrospira platensis FACHB-835]MDF2209373.1 hypothetical protein [Arthrospira platensis NCB002]MDT9184069.1 hypothetical protein [Limnospira sp. PMC 289.06]MDT9296244.1 hypothetical protein
MKTLKLEIQKVSPCLFQLLRDYSPKPLVDGILFTIDGDSYDTLMVADKISSLVAPPWSLKEV